MGEFEYSLGAMKNLLLLSGMDGTGILFRPLLDELNQSDVNYRIAIMILMLVILKTITIKH